MKADMHVHSSASDDAVVDPVQVLRILKSRGFGAVAILDHNSVKGSITARKSAEEVGIIVIRGTEVSSSLGHIGALRVEEEIPKGLSPQETVDRIHGMGGLAVALHPYRTSTGIGENTVRSIKFDAVEARNGFTSNRKNAKSKALAESLGLPCTAGSDGHREDEMGRVFLDLPECADEGEVLKAILEGKGSPNGRGLGIGGSLAGSLVLTGEWMRRGFHRL